MALRIYGTQPGEVTELPSRAPANVLDEAALMARVTDPNVTRVYGAEGASDPFGMWMEPIDGRTLQEIVQTAGTILADEARLIGRQVCVALVAVHKADLLHRDIQANNIMREADGCRGLMAFGVGTVVEADGGARRICASSTS